MFDDKLIIGAFSRSEATSSDNTLSLTCYALVFRHETVDTRFFEIAHVCIIRPAFQTPDPTSEKEVRIASIRVSILYLQFSWL